MIIVASVLPDGTLKETRQFADGTTLHHAALALFPEEQGKAPAPLIALVGDKPAVRSLGDWDFPLADGAQVQFRQLALGGGGGGSSPLQIVMQVAIIALSVAAAYYAPGLVGVAADTLAGSIVAGLSGAGVMMLGTMITGALFPARMPQGQVGASGAEQASPTYGINADGNQARLYQPEPEGFGRMKIVPDFVANTWTHYSGNDQIGYFVYGLGRGRYEVESLQFGETVFWRDGSLVEGTGYEIQDIEFVEPGNPVTIFPDNVITSAEVSGQALFAPNDEEYQGAAGPYATNPAGTATNKLLFDFIFQQGIGWYDDEGRLQECQVAWSIEYQRVDDFGNPLSEWAVLDSLSFKGATLTPQRLTKEYAVAPGRYQCRARRVSETRGDGRTMDSLLWAAMRAMLPGTYAYPQSCVAFSIRATNALTHNASRQFAAIVTRKLPLYDRKTKTWSDEVPTRSWAAAVAHVCRCSWGGRLDDAHIDLDALWSIDETLQAKGWHYDGYIDGAYLVWTLINEMCQSQCVMPRLVGPVLSFVMDAPERPPSFALTPRTIVRDSFNVEYITWSDDMPDDVTLDYVDAAHGFQQRDVTASLPESESREPASLSIIGITDRDHAHDVAVAYAAHNRWQRIAVTCRTEALGRIVNRGDICTVAHPRFKNTASGVVASWREPLLELTLKHDMDRLAPEGAANDGNGLYLALTRQDGSLWGPCKLAALEGNVARLDNADYGTLLLQGQENPFEWLTAGEDRAPTTWIVYTSRTYQRLMVVDSVSSQDALRYSLRLLNYDSRVYQYDDLPTPPWQGRGQLPSSDSLEAPGGLRGTAENGRNLVLTWLPTAGAAWYEVETSSDGQTWINQGRANMPGMTVAVPLGRVYARVRAASETVRSGWARWQGDLSIPIPEVPGLRLEKAYRGGEAVVSWPPVAHAQGYSVALRRNGRTLYAAQTSLPSFAVTPEIQQGGPYRELTLAVAARGANGASAEAALSLEDPAPSGVIEADVLGAAESVTLRGVVPDTAQGATGYVLARGEGPDFEPARGLAMRQAASLPYTWSGLAAGRQYFRVAVKDAFFELTQNPLELNWSPVVTVETTGKTTGEGNG